MQQALELVKKAAGLGATDYLLKPFDIDLLEKTVNDILRPSED